MAHHYDTGYTTQKAAWHAFETGMPVLDNAPATWALAREAAKLTWEPKVVQSFYLKRADLVTDDDNVIAQTTQEGLVFAIVEDTNGRKVIRDDTEKVLGSGVGTNWTPVTNQQLGEVAEALADEGAQFWTAGSLYEGRKVFVTMKLGEPFVIGNDNRMVQVPFVSLTNAHDGSGSFFAMPTMFEVVCANTAKAAEVAGEGMGRLFTFKHTGSVVERINEAKSAIAGCRQELNEIRRMEEELYALKIDKADIELFLDLFPATKPVDEVGANAKVRGNVDRARKSWFKAFESPTLSDDHRESALGLWRASTEYCDHVQIARGTYGRAHRSLLAIHPLKAQAANIARQVATR